MESILANLQSTGIFIIVLSILIVVHEWGHFITAKLLGFKVEKFALGFGKKLFSFKHDGTEFMLCLIPLGGYVKMAGDERSECKGSPEEFYSKPVGHRALVVLNGPVVNFILAYISLVIVFLLGYPGLSSKISEITSNSPAVVADIQRGDKIIAIDSHKIYGWMHLERLLEGTSTTPIEVTLERNGQVLTKTVTPQITRKPNLLGEERDIRDIGIGALSNEVGDVIKDHPAEKAGLMKGDKIVEINSVQTLDWTSVQENISHSSGEEILITVERGSELLQLKVSPKIEKIKEKSGEEKEVRRVGVVPSREFDMFKFGLGDSFKNAYEELSFITVLTYKALYRLVTGKMSARESVTGPVGIFFVVKGAAQEGFSHLLFILGMISASLAIFNLLPVIPLDGGHLFLLAIEKIRGKALPAKVDEAIARIGFSLIILLAVFVFYSDFVNFGIFDKIGSIFR